MCFGIAVFMRVGCIRRNIAKRAESTPEGLAAWMQASHPKMPNYMFEGPDVGDLAAFILSLRQSPG